MSKIHPLRDGRHVDVTLREIRTTPDIFWSERCNSYVLTEPGTHPRFKLPDGTPVRLVSINGIGEIRWDVERWGLGPDQDGPAVEHFKLTLIDP